jgi:F-type H+-transporting ATPase subunit delta
MGMVDSSQGTRTADIGRQQVGAVYARALLASAEKLGSTDDVISELEAVISELLERFPRLDATLSSQRLSAAEKSAMIDHLLGPRVSDLLLRFLKVVCAHGRLDCLREISREARRLLNDRRGVKHVRLVTASPIGDDLAGQVAERLRSWLGSDVQLARFVDESLIGGVVIRIGDKVYDGSVANRLNQVRSEALEKTVQQMRGVTERFAVVS